MGGRDTLILMRCALLLGVLLLACEDTPEPLTPAAVRNIHTQRGDADGYGLTGAYTIGLIANDCPCDGSPVLDALSLCASLPFAPGQELLVTVSVVQTDGTILIRNEEGNAFFGPLWADGSFIAAEVVNLGSLASKGFRVVLLEGTFDDLDAPAPTVEATLQMRVVGKAILSPFEGGAEGRGDGEQVSDFDCVESLEVNGTRRL